MAEKDDDFLDGEGGEPAAGKEGGKGGPKVASALILQILKWVLIIIGFLVLTVTTVVVTIKIMGVGEEKNTRVEESPEYQSVVPVLSWYGQIGELRGSTKDDERKTFIVEVQIGYPDQDPATQNELITKQIQIKDMLLTWFSRQSAAYLRNIDKREEIRETIKAEINFMLSLPVSDIRFTSYQILDF